ncbi:hypothetical protein D3C74_423980 [compost metagenome]
MMRITKSTIAILRPMLGLIDVSNFRQWQAAQSPSAIIASIFSNQKDNTKYSIRWIKGISIMLIRLSVGHRCSFICP